MAKVQNYLPYSSQGVSNYTTWGQAFGTALSTFGWSKVADAAGVNWGTITASNIPSNQSPYGNVIYAGAFATNTQYSGVGPGSNGTFNVVTQGGYTWACIVNNFYTLSSSVPNATNSFTITATGTTSSNQTSFTCSGLSATSNFYAGWSFTISGLTGAAAVFNGNTFMCYSSTSTTVTLMTVTQVLGGGSIISASATTGQSGTAATSANNTTYYYSVTNAQFNNNAWYGLSVNISGYGNAGNNGNFTVVNSSQSTSPFGTTVCVNNSGGSAQTGQSGTIISNTVPTSDLYHWQPYNYEIWQTNDAASSVQPIYFKIVYGSMSVGTPSIVFATGTATTTATIQGNTPGEVSLGYTLSTGLGSTFECDFCGDSGNFAVILWRDAASKVAIQIPITFFIDRARDQNGNGLASFYNTGWVGQSTNLGRFYTVFQSGIGGVIVFETWPRIEPSGSSAIQSLAYAGMTPVLPIFPLPGYVANPCLQAVTMKINDFSDGQLFNAVLYGTSHTFLMSKSIALDNSSGVNSYPGIRWE